MIVRLPESFCQRNEAVLVEWCVEVGATVKRWQLLAYVENDKCAYEFCSKVGLARVQALLVPAGATVEAGQALAELEVLEA